MSKVDLKVEDGSFNVGVDTNEDGQEAVKLKVNLSEALGEAMKNGVAIEGAKVVEVKFELTKLVVKLDTDKDGEELLSLEVDLAEAVDEASGIFKKD
ncbi:MAG: hypothetical protein ACTSRU_02100 [Candidatus Hodarchaeales archaeon]|jgi:hypothetical protein